MQPNELVSVIGDLVVTLEDDRKGFEMASERLAEDGHPDLAEILIDLSTQRQLFSTQLKNEAADRGITIEENGSVMGTLNRGWAALADSVTGDDPHALLAAAERGEDETMSKYREVLDRTDLGELRPIIESQAFQVREAHDHVKTLRDTAR